MRLHPILASTHAMQCKTWLDIMQCDLLVGYHIPECLKLDLVSGVIIKPCVRVCPALMWFVLLFGPFTSWPPRSLPLTKSWPPVTAFHLRPGYLQNGTG